MAEPTLTMEADDDLPRTIRRERDAKAAREREAREREERDRLTISPAPVRTFERQAPERQAPQNVRQMPYSFAAPSGPPVAMLDVPFSRLVAFFVKAVFAAIPALIILVAALWLAGHGLQTLYPDMMKLKVLIYTK